MTQVSVIGIRKYEWTQGDVNPSARHMIIILSDTLMFTVNPCLPKPKQSQLSLVHVIGNMTGKHPATCVAEPASSARQMVAAQLA